MMHSHADSWDRYHAACERLALLEANYTHTQHRYLQGQISQEVYELAWSLKLSAERQVRILRHQLAMEVYG
ncbi:hypothetical protein LZS97_14475 [Vibrio fluvialis]|uniref:hypothetical protein n=1 Tax=Vibrio fluvialis TaxID=676 RepID=UPI001F40D485|nr:hypothetical protein [Vibrio fluvialis]MCE7611393.1 hypothetical protein [Vibrio fluvialis]MCE7621600.1 hypothetical protein [Vibrio fluvialis]MCE7626698.1 hypothetical protein [Vibrio fluvialis]